ncbi:uncharacterized protein PV09_05703 [Verruconis gallopava]|uniref:Uncharacterized protein n=1 Tax=Verruconis gallopava TaxID=253628 RepID=A0A0D1YR68_9PEZI|nr:uncharacterized protein PV09_05703 [Verruconis gallopava]KIW03052.1 hypothetical protein PV09_05703 [Verruconis gallopava]
MDIAVRRSPTRRWPTSVFELLGAAPRASTTYAFLRVNHQYRRQITIDQLNNQKKGRERVVILGSGWAGFTVARRLDPKKFQAVIVSPRSYFAFTPLLASCSVGTLEFRTALEPVRSRRLKADFLQGWAEKLDLVGKKVTIEEAADDPKQGLGPTERTIDTGRDPGQLRREGKLFDLAYDKLVIAVGCYSQTFGTPGVKENAYFLKDVGDARKIRKRLLDCFETAALPTTSEKMRKILLNFAVVGGGPTGIEFSAELHDLVTEDMARLYPDLIKYFRITVYDLAPKVLAMFDESLAKYAMEHFKREGIHIRTSHHVQELRVGPPVAENAEAGSDSDGKLCYTLKTEEEGEIGVGMCVWSTGLMMNPFVQKQSDILHGIPQDGVDLTHVDLRDADKLDWILKKHPRTGGLVTDRRLRLVLQPKERLEEDSRVNEETSRAVIRDVYALGDCATIENTMFPATAQVASQKAEWLAKRLNKGDIDKHSFQFKNLGVMAYLGNWNAAFQPGSGGEISGRVAFLIWRGAYLTKSVSLRNKILIPTYYRVPIMGVADELKERANAFVSGVSTPAGPGNFLDSHASAQKTSRPAFKHCGISISDQSSQSGGSGSEEECDYSRDHSSTPRYSALNSSSHYITPNQPRADIPDDNHNVHGVDEPILASIKEASDDDIPPQPFPRSVADNSKRSVERHSISSSSGRRYVSSSSSLSRSRPSNLQQQLSSPPNVSLQSLISSLTTSSGSSGNSTVTQKSYDKRSIRRKRPEKNRRSKSDDVLERRTNRSRKETSQGNKTKTPHGKSKSPSKIKMEEEEGPIKANMSRPGSSASRGSRKDSIFSPPTPSSRRSSISKSRASSRNESSAQWKRQDTLNFDSGISVTSSPEASAPSKVLEDETVDHDDSAFDSSDEASGSDAEAEEPHESPLPFMAPSPSENFSFTQTQALPDADPYVQRLQEQEAAMQHHILHSPQPKRTIRPKVSSSFHPSPVLPLYDHHATSAVPAGHPISSSSSSIPHGDPTYFQAYYETHDQHLRPSGNHFQVDTQRTTIAGYEMLAKKLSESSDRDPSAVKPLYRRFEELNHRVLLHLQDEISELEEELRALDEVIAQMSSLPDDTIHPASRRIEARYGSEVHFRRTQILGKIFLKLQQYNQGLTTYSDAKNKYTPAGESDITAYRAWMAEHVPIEPNEGKYLDRGDDLMFPGKQPAEQAKSPTNHATYSSELTLLMTMDLIMLATLLIAFSIVPGPVAKILLGGVLLCCLAGTLWFSKDKSIGLRSKKDA